MTEQNNIEQVSKRRTSSLTIAAVCVTAAGVVSIWSLRFAEGLALLGLFVFMPVALLLNIVSLLQIIYSKGRLKGLTFVIAVILVQLIVAVPFGHFIATERIATRISCKCELKHIHNALLQYANRNRGKYPDAKQWCDTLITDSEMPEKLFCKIPSEYNTGLCHYAINANCQPDSPGDVVLLFETRGRWNLSGTAESLNSTDNYKKGWRVLFNNGNIEFIEPHELSKLKW